MGYGGTGGDLPGLLPLDKEHPDVKSIFLSGDVDDDYEVEKDPIARGKFAAVRLVRHRISKKIYAAKYLRRRGRAVSLEKEARHEIAVLLVGKTDPNIIHMHHVYEARSEYVIILEFGSGGDLQRLLDDQSRFQEKTVRDLLVQILRGLGFLHERRIAHLDIKPQNIVLMGQSPEDGVKLVDFGLSRVILQNVELTQIMGTPDYVAPEVINYEPVNLTTDMWSIGVLTYVFLTGCTPFGGNTDQETFVNITQGEFDFPDELFGDVSAHAKDYISSLLIKSTNLRMTVDQSLNHSWISSSAISESDSADSGYSTEILNGSPPSNLSNGFLSHSVSSLSCQYPVINEEEDSLSTIHSHEQHPKQTLNKYQKSPVIQSLLSNAPCKLLNSDRERKPKLSSAHTSINVMESFYQIPPSQRSKSHRRNSLVIDDLRYSDRNSHNSSNLDSVRNDRYLSPSNVNDSFVRSLRSSFNRSCSNEISWSDTASRKSSSKQNFDQDSIRNITKPWENLCGGSYIRAMNQLQNKGAHKKKQSKNNYFGLKSEFSYSMYDLNSVPDCYGSSLNISENRKLKSESRSSKSGLKKSKSDFKGSKSDLRTSRTDLRNKNPDLRSSNLDLSSYDRDLLQRVPLAPRGRTNKSSKNEKSDNHFSPLSSHEAITRLNMSLSRLDLSDCNATATEESEERDVVYTDFTLPRRFNRNYNFEPMLRGNSLHMSFRLPRKRDGNV